VATAVFVNQEEVELKALYRDPVHDFGFFQYDPKALKHLEVEALSLRPDEAKIGVEIRVIGNDAGEKLSILDGTLARLNRDAPAYGRFRYNDFNTFYIQAASGATGGSSGSPVVNIRGEVVALQAGGSFSANTNMFFPLDRVVHAYNHLIKGENVDRGTLQTTFKYRSYAELRRLGIAEAEEAALRANDPDSQGALVVDTLLPKGPADGILAPGDILYKLNGTLVGSFIPLEDFLDSHVGQTVPVTLIRGGTIIEQEITIGNLADITPSDYLEIGRAVLHNNSYQQARHLNKPIEGVVVATPGYMFGRAGIASGAVISSINKQPVKNLVDAKTILEQIPANEEFPVRFYSISDSHNDSIAIVKNQRHWHPANFCSPSENTGLWQCEPLADAPPAMPPVVQNAQYPQQQTELANEIAPSLVWVNFSTPYPVDEIGNGRSSGTGMVLDAKEGLLLVDRTTVPASLGSILLTFAGSIQIPAEVAYMHPLHNMALLKYDPALLGETVVNDIKLAEAGPLPDDIVTVVGTNYNYQVLAQERKVSTYSPLKVNSGQGPKFTDANLMVIATDTSYSHSSGAFLNDAREVVAMIVGYGAGRGKSNFWAISVQHIHDLLKLYRSGQDTMRSLEVEWGLISFVAARRLGIPEDWLNRFANEHPDSHQLLAVNNTWKGSDAENKLLSGDILLAVDDQLVRSFREVEMSALSPKVKLTIARSGEVMDLTVETMELDTQGTDEVLLWAGANLQMPHRAIRTQLGITTPGIYVSRQSYGSPAQHFGIRGHIITAVDDKPTPDLQAFIEAVKDKQDRDSVRLKVLQLSGQEQVITLTLSDNYWPMALVKRTETGWQRLSL
jgi:S1-C subfamily serine protease